MQKRVETAKSYFALSHTFAYIGTALMVAAGLVFNGLISIFSLVAQKSAENTNILIQNASFLYGVAGANQIFMDSLVNLAGIIQKWLLPTLVMSLVFLLSSLVSWSIGKHKLSKLK